MQTQLVLEILLLTFVRTTELRSAKWEEIDFTKAEWRILAERMKMREQHIMMLSKQVFAIFEALNLISGFRDHLFPSHTKPRPFISENTLLYAMYRMCYHE